MICWHDVIQHTIMYTAVSRLSYRTVSYRTVPHGEQTLTACKSSDLPNTASVYINGLSPQPYVLLPPPPKRLFVEGAAESF